MLVEIQVKGSSKVVSCKLDLFLLPVANPNANPSKCTKRFSRT